MVEFASSSLAESFLISARLASFELSGVVASADAAGSEEAVGAASGLAVAAGAVSGLAVAAGAVSGLAVAAGTASGLAIAAGTVVSVEAAGEVGAVAVVSEEALEDATGASLWPKAKTETHIMRARIVVLRMCSLAKE
jgi:hypothetical protein